MDKGKLLNEISITVDEMIEKQYEEAYNKGLEDAWKLIKEIFYMPTKEYEEIFDVCCIDVLSKYTPQEAIAKLEAYEKEQEEIKVGDVVFNDDTLEEGVVTHIEEGLTFMLYNDGSCGETKGKLTKTGKHIDISSVLEQIKE